MVISEYLLIAVQGDEAANADELFCVLQQLELRIDVVFTDVKCRGRWTASASPSGTREPARHRCCVGRQPGAATEAAADLCESGPS